MDEHSWQLLLDRISSGLCAPFLGAAVSSPPLPTAPDLSDHLAELFQYPMEDRWDLKAVSQYAAVKTDHVFVKEAVCKELRTAKSAGRRGAGSRTPPRPSCALTAQDLPNYELRPSTRRCAYDSRTGACDRLLSLE